MIGLHVKCLQNWNFNQITVNLNNLQICALSFLNHLMRTYILKIAITAVTK
jgi:hypothetical protein